MDASAGRSSTIGLTLVRRKWSGQLVPSAASRGCSALAEEFEHDDRSSVKCPTWALSVEASPRMKGASAAALARRSCSGSAAYPASAGPNGSAWPLVSM